MVEIVFKKRKAQPGEIGLFLDTEVFREEFSSLPMDADVKAECTVPANLKYLKFFWALVGKVTENSPDGFLDKQDCADRILLEARHFKVIVDSLRNKTEVKPKSISGLSADTWVRLLRRVTDVVVMKFLPGMDRNVLKSEIEAMVGVDNTPDPAPKPRASRAKKSDAKATTPQAEASDPPKGGEAAARADEGKEPGSPPRSAPTNEAEYVAACLSWLKKQPADARHAAFDYFNGPVHQKMRLDLKVRTETRKSLERQIGEYFDAKDKEARAS